MKEDQKPIFKWQSMYTMVLVANLIPVVLDHLAYFPVLWELFRTERYGLFGLDFAIDMLPGERSRLTEIYHCQQNAVSFLTRQVF